MTPADLAALSRYLAHGRHPNAPPALYDACRAAVAAAEAPRRFDTPDGRPWPNPALAPDYGLCRDEWQTRPAPCFTDEH